VIPVHKIRSTAFALRGGLWTALFLAVWFVAKPASKGAVAGGLALVVLGQLIRFWAVGCITRYRGERVGAERLVTWGPYGLVRNPLYVGNGLIGLGWAVLAGPTAIVIFCVAFILIYAVLIVPYEEQFLRGKFGAAYDDYAATTGRFFPKSWNPARLTGPFDRSVLWVSERHSLLVTVLGTALLLVRTL
jgi:protein-S-isoprenylcysteine O-methyltransferase Ste14